MTYDTKDLTALSNAEAFELVGPFGFVFEVIIAYPGGGRPVKAPIPAMLVLDGNTNLPIAAAAARMQAVSGVAEQIAVVSIATLKSEGFDMAIAKRLKYMSPGFPTLTDRAHDALQRMLQPLLTANSWSYEQGFGGGDEFHEFIISQVLPTLASDYGIDTQRSAIHGHSVAGAFVIHSLMQKPDSFIGYSASSFGTQWWTDFEAEFDKFLREKRTRSSAKPSFLYHAAGGQELEDPGIVEAGFGTPVLKRFEKRELPNLRLETQVFPDENHASIVPHAISTTVRKFFGVERNFLDALETTDS